jgi:hypothetical protein
MQSRRLEDWTAKDFEGAAFAATLEDIGPAARGQLYAAILLSRSVESVREALLAVALAFHPRDRRGDEPE